MKKIYILLIAMILMVSCVDSLDEYNVDQKNATKVPPATLFSNALKNLSDLITTPNVNVNNFRLYVQHWSTTTYTQEPRYDLLSRLIPQNWWQTSYKDVLADLKESRRLVEADEVTGADIKANQLAQIGIMEVYAWSILVNTFGDVPYTEALDPEVSLPNYDDAATIYADILNRLDAALGSIVTAEDGFVTGDLIYGGEMDQWELFGNSLKLKLALIVADVPSFSSQALVEEAVASGVFESNDNNATFPYISTPPNNNPLSANLNPTYSSRQDFVMANTLVDMMNALNDPRRPLYFTDVSGDYIGGIYGFQNDYSAFSHINPMVIEETFESLLIDYSEVEFLLAEAAARGYNVGGGTVEEHYDAAITASIMYWGGDTDDATDYLAQADVAYATATGDYKEKIGNQKWIALFNRGYDAWTEWRRLDFPVLEPPSGAGVSGLVIPVRIIYPINEQTLNGSNREEASTAIGGDAAETALFWDVN